MAHNGVKPVKIRITVKRLERIQTELYAMARGNWTIAQISEATGISERTVSRDLNHPAAKAIVYKLQERRQHLADQLIRRQIQQIESGAVKPASQLYHRGKLISRLLPTKVEQQVRGELKQKLEVKIPELTDEDIARYVPIIFKVVLEQESREPDPDAAEEDPEESVD